MKVSNFRSPVYDVIAVDIDEIVSQKTNPNQMTAKSWDALQQSINNGGYVAPVQIAPNVDYDPATNGQPKPSLIEHTDNSDNVVKNSEGGMQVADDEVGKYFKYRLIDGAHRTQIVRLGKYYFEHGYDYSDLWAEGKHIPEKPSYEMLAFLAWRENFKMPCVILDVDQTTQMSIEILMNTARGAHSLDSMKDIVYNLINVAGMSEEWVSQNLYLDLESIKRMQQLSGLKASMNDIDDADLAWTPESDDAYGRKLTAYLSKEAGKFIEIYRAEHPYYEIPAGDAITVAVDLGFDKSRVMEEYGDRWKEAL